MVWQCAVDNLYSMLSGVEVSLSGGTTADADAAFSLWLERAAAVRKQDRTMYLIGNGASASMASHCAADLSKNGGIRTKVFTDLSEITAIGNDIGFEHIYSVPLARYARQGDMLVAISSSGRSPNILNAVHAVKGSGVSVVTLSGFSPENPLRGSGDLNIYVPAKTYGLVETCHAAILHYWMDGMTL